MKKLLLLSYFFLLTFSSFSQASNTWSVKFSDAIISRWPTTINSMTGKGWEYSNSIITHGMEKVYNNVNTAAYLTYIRNYVDAYVNSSGVISATLSSLDRVHPGISCLFLYEKTGLAKYQTAATTLRNLIVGPSATYSKTSGGPAGTNGILWHKLSGYNNIMMLDGMYMAHPFLAKYGSMFGDNAAIDTAVNQTLFAYNQLYNSTTHLIKHAWTSTPASYPAWANSSTGNSSEVWSRAMGWYVMALVDILKYVPAAHPKRAQLLTALSNLAIGIKDYQDATTGLWYQVVDKGVGHAGYTAANYIETSGSAMFVYALKTGVDSGWLSSATYLPVAQSGWAGLKALEITIYSGDSKPQINNFAPAMSVQNDYAGYVGITSVDCPTTTNPHGYAAILMAASVMEFPLSTLPVRFISFTAKEYTDKTRLSWQNGDETEVDHYEIQKSVNGNDFIVIGTAASTGLSTYTFDDNAIDNKTVYYRINAVSFTGSAHYSAIIPVKKNSRGFEMKISPNPVQDGAVNIFLANITSGTYSIKVITSAGHIIKTGSIIVNDESNVVKTISLPSAATRGIYYVQLEGNGLNINKSIIVK